MASFEEVPPTDEMGRRMAELSGTHPWLVAERDGEVAGYAYAARTTHAPPTVGRRRVRLRVPEHRREGVGRELYEELFERLREQGLTWPARA